MEISRKKKNSGGFDNNLFFHFPANKFKKGTFYSPMNFYDYEINDMIVENYEFNITKLTQHFIYIKIKFQPEDDEIILKKKIKKDVLGEYITFIDSLRINKYESLLYLNTCIFFNSAFFRPEYLKDNINDKQNY